MRSRLMFALVVAFISNVVVFGCSYDNRERANGEARSYLAAMYPNSHERSVQCMMYDTDNNGYVSCDAIVDGRMVALECAACSVGELFCGQGCKMRPLVQVRQTEQTQ